MAVLRLAATGIGAFLALAGVCIAAILVLLAPDGRASGILPLLAGLVVLAGLGPLVILLRG